MKIEIFSLCDAATNEAGKLNLLGTFDTILTNAFPVVYPQCAIAMRIRFTSVENGRHALAITIVDADGKKLIQPVTLNVQVHIPDGETTTSINFVFNLQQLKFEKAGEYAIDLAIGGRAEGSLPLMIKAKK